MSTAHGLVGGAYGSFDSFPFPRGQPPPHLRFLRGCFSGRRAAVISRRRGKGSSPRRVRRGRHVVHGSLAASLKLVNVTRESDESETKIRVFLAQDSKETTLEDMRMRLPPQSLASFVSSSSSASSRM